VLLLGEIDSTNEEAKRRAQAGDAGGLWILAERQSAGRGRRGRVWESTAGNLMTTLLLRPEAPAAKCAELSFVAGLAAVDAFEALGGRDVQLKWPNDVLIGGAKAGGILLESSGAASDRLDWLAIGFGLNLAWAPRETPYPATALAEHVALAATPEQALTALAGAWANWFTLWTGHGFAPIRDAWLSRARGLGEPIVARLGNTEIEGVFEDLDPTGALVLRTTSGHRTIAAGEVFFGRAA
jgi:BirA family transcriptional regulator, biotin operon repressor / biotin---[acetyl-CoA-carboxylase] ligase